MTTEELRELNNTVPNSAAPAGSQNGLKFVLDEEDDFLREMRQLAGMDAQEPSAPVAATASAGKNPAPAPEQRWQFAVQEQETPPAQKTRRRRAPAQQPVQPPVQPQRQEWAPAQPQRQEWAPEAVQLPQELVKPEPLLAGWQKGMMLVFGSASVLVLTVLAVLHAL